MPKPYCTWADAGRLSSAYDERRAAYKTQYPVHAAEEATRGSSRLPALNNSLVARSGGHRGAATAAAPAALSRSRDQSASSPTDTSSTSSLARRGFDRLQPRTCRRIACHRVPTADRRQKRIRRRLSSRIGSLRAYGRVDLPLASEEGPSPPIYAGVTYPENGGRRSTAIHRSHRLSRAASSLSSAGSRPHSGDHRS